MCFSQNIKHFIWKRFGLKNRNRGGGGGEKADYTLLKLRWRDIFTQSQQTTLAEKSNKRVVNGEFNQSYQNKVTS